MKKLLIISLVILSSCNKDFLKEDPKGQFIGADAVNSVTSLEQLLLGSYKSIMNPWDAGIVDGGFMAIINGGDDLCAIPLKAELAEFDTYTETSLNDRIRIVWQGIFESIQCSNGVITAAPSIKAANSEEQTRIDQIVGEAHFMRANMYYLAVRLWGDIPLVTDPFYSPDKLTVQKSSVAEVYALIEDDLKKAETMMSDVKPDVGRANAGSAKAFLADVYLTEGGWPMNDPSKYALAATKAKEVIDNQDTYGFNLNTPLEVLWNGDPAADRKSEEVWALYLNPAQGTYNTIYGAGPRPGEEGGWDDFLPEIYFYKHFPAGLRKNLTFDTVYYTSPTDSVFYAASNTRHPCYRKFYSTDGITWATSNALCLYRFAQVLLTYAEAQSRSAGAPNAEAYTALNAVRIRAGLAPLSGLTPEAFNKAVVDEKSWEFAGEYTRWFDLKRLKMVEEVNDDSKKDADDYKVIGTIKYYVPIPAVDKQINPNL
jgi:starch-binding outer membrane protein, SusD/RagB family